MSFYLLILCKDINSYDNLTQWSINSRETIQIQINGQLACDEPYQMRHQLDTWTLAPQKTRGVA